MTDLQEPQVVFRGTAEGSAPSFPGGLQFSLQKRIHRAIFLVVTALIASVLAAEAARYWLAETWAKSSQVSQIERATRIQPGMADTWYRLALHEKANLSSGGRNSALQFMKQAVEISPLVSMYWMELGRAHELEGLEQEADQAFLKARELDPTSPRPSWAYGNFLIRRGDLNRGLVEIRHAVSAMPSLTTLAVSQTWRLAGDIEPIMDHLLPATQSHYVQAMRYLLAQDQLDACLKVWDRYRKIDEPIVPSHSFPLVEKLILQGRVSDAQRVWAQAIEGIDPNGTAPDSGTLITNGGFELDSLNAGFGWRLSRHPALTVEYDTAVAAAGARSLRIEFDGTTNLDYRHLRQIAAVMPETQYRFSALVRTGELTTDRGILFEMWDVQNRGNLNLRTQEIHGTEPWKQLTLRFTTGPMTRLIAVAARRYPSKKFDNKIRGTVWIDDVRLVPIVTEVRNPVR